MLAPLCQGLVSLRVSLAGIGLVINLWTRRDARTCNGESSLRGRWPLQS